jgi:hypothetical protein
VVSEEVTAPAAAAVPNIWTGGWLQGLSLIGEWNGQLVFFPNKSPGMEWIFPALLQEEQRIALPYVVKIFHAYLATGYVPAIRHQVNIVFIGRKRGPRDFRPSVSHCSYLRPWRGW